MKLGLKCSISDSQFYERLSNFPDIIEFHLNEDDLFGNNRKILESRIEECLDNDIKVYLHQPMKICGDFLNVMAIEPLRIHYLELTTILLKDICLKYGIKCIIHMNYGTLKREYEMYNKELDVELIYNNLLNITLDFLDRHDKDREFILIENSINGWGSYKEDLILAKLLSETDIRLCLDTSHAFISFDNLTAEGKNNSLLETLKILNNNIDYYHVVDSSCLVNPKIHDSLNLGVGLIDWNLIKEYIINKDYIYEVGLINQENCIEMVESHNYFSSI